MRVAKSWSGSGPRTSRTRLRPATPIPIADCAGRWRCGRHWAPRSWSTSRWMHGRRRPRTCANSLKTLAYRRQATRPTGANARRRWWAASHRARESPWVTTRRPLSIPGIFISSIRKQAWASTTPRRKEHLNDKQAQGSRHGPERSRSGGARRARRLRQQQQLYLELEQREQDDRLEVERKGQHLDRRHLGGAGAEELPARDRCLQQAVPE